MTVYTTALNEISHIRRVVLVATTPVILLAALLLSRLLLDRTGPVPVATAVGLIAAGALLWPLEQWAPFEATWAPNAKAVEVDGLHSLISALVVVPLVRGLSQILATSDFHRWHHSRDLLESNTNFGNATVLWDRVFGTMVLSDRPLPRHVGVDGLELSESCPVHLIVPFRLDHYETGDA